MKKENLFCFVFFSICFGRGGATLAQPWNYDYTIMFFFLVESLLLELFL